MRCNDFQSPYYLTFKQAKELGGTVKAGEKGTPIVYWQILEKETKNTSGELKKKKIPLLKYYTVFNAEQITGIEFPQVENQVRNVDLLENIIENLNEKPIIKHNPAYQPCYVPMLDEIRMPIKASYYSAAKYYQTLYHELGHWTGATKRLNREGISQYDKFGSKRYSMEELIVEMVSAYAMNFAGLEASTLDQSASYINGWLKVLQNDQKFVFKAAKLAEQAWKFLSNEVIVIGEQKEAA